MLKKVSVIIPFYNNLEWLIEAVESALNQTYQNLEIIIVNDGSREDIGGFLSKYGERITYHYQKNEGAASARNHAMKLATGEYYAFLDSDDIWLPNKLEKQISFMEETNAKWSHTNYYHWNPDNDTLKNIGIRDEYGDIFKKTFVSVKMATPCVVLDICIFEAHPHLSFNENYRMGEDTRFWQGISKNYPIALLREPLAKIRLREDNTYKQTIAVLNLRAAAFQEVKNNPNAPFVAKTRSFIFYSYSKVFKPPSTPKKDFLVRCSLVLPYLMGRSYVKYLSILNNKYENLVR